MAGTTQADEKSVAVGGWRPRDWKTDGPLRLSELTHDQILILLSIEDDDPEGAQEAPWMSMGYPQFWAVTDFASALQAYARTEGLRWLVAGLLPIRWPIPGTSEHGNLSPDVYVVPGKDPRPLPSYNLEEEGVFPPFVLEVLSPSSVARDVEHKRSVYEALGGREYALFAPTSDLRQPPLQGWKRDASGTFAVWEPDDAGRFFSDVLGLYLVAEGMDLRAETPTGRRLLTLDEAEETMREQQRELDRLRAELERRNRE